MKKEVAIVALLCAVSGVFAADGDGRLDELGQVPRLRAKFDGNFDSSGDEQITWDKRSLPRRPEWIQSRAGKALKMSAEGGCPVAGRLGLGDEWTILVVATGPKSGSGVVWSADGRGGNGGELALVGDGRGGVRLVARRGRMVADKVVAAKGVEHFSRQFHAYAMTKDVAGNVALWIDGKRTGSAALDFAISIDAIRFGASRAENDGAGDGAAFDDFRIYDMALGEAQLLQIASGNQPWPDNLPKARERVSAYIDTNAVLRLGYELPNRIVVGADGEKRLYVKGLLAQCGIGGEKRFELRDGGAFALGSEGFVFDSNYAMGRTNEIVFAGGAIGVYDKTFIKSAAPIRLEGKVRLVAMKQLVVRASFEGPGDIVKTGVGTVGIQYPCDNATGTFRVASASTLALGPAASWGGTIELAPGATLKCVSRSAVGRIVAAKGANVVETVPGTSLGKDAFPQPATAYNFRKMRRPSLGRGVYAVRADEREVLVGWRYLSSDAPDAAFDVFADGKKLNSAPIRDVTQFRTPWSGGKTTYSVRPSRTAGQEKKPEPSSSWTLTANAPVGCFDIELTPPPKSALPDGKTVGHHPCDCSVGDLDGDGTDELVVIWWPDNAGDNSSWHVTGETWLEGVKLDGSNRSLWKINLGRNIRSGSHYTPVMVADFDGDGKAEVVCRTSDGTVDGKGRTLGDAKADWREQNGHVLWAPNFVTVFDGRTGAAMDSVPFRPDVLSDAAKRAAKDVKAINREWSSRNPGNQAFRFLSAIAYLDGVRPSVVMCRGYYSRTCLWALDWNGKNLKDRWFFCSDEPRWWGYGGQGFHNLRVADVDFDGKDEIIYGHMTVDHDGRGLYTTGMGHGDAMHVIQSAPDVRGLQVWTCHEASPHGVSLFDAQTGKVAFWTHGPTDTGSCNAMDIDAAFPGVELFSGANCGIYSAKTHQRYLHPKPNPRINYFGTLRFGIWWLGDMTRSAYSGGSVIRGYSVKGRTVNDIIDLGEGVDSNHGSKGCPCLIADIFGDWREEILLRRADNRAIRVFTSAEPTKWRFHTFMEDPVYRASVLTQNNGYNIPTGTGFYFGPDLLGHGIEFRGTRLP